LGSFTVYEDEDGKDVLDASSVQASLVAAYPISPVVNIYGRLGLAKLTVDESIQYFDYEEYNESNSQSKNKTFYGIGASYAINSQFSLRAEYDRYSKWDGLTVSALTIGAVYSF